MAPTRRGNEGLLARVNFPLYTVQMLTSHHIIVGGGGGSSKTGVANGFEIFELMFDGKKFVAEEMIRHETGPSVVMNCACHSTSKRMYLVAGQESHCQLYNVNVDIVEDDDSRNVSPEDEANNSSVRRRRTLSKSENGNSKSNHSKSNKVDSSKDIQRRLRFNLKPDESVQSDFSKEEPLQRVVRISLDGNLMATGGTDGVVRLWEFPSMKPKFSMEAHAKEIDDLDFSPDNKSLASISKDGQAFTWCCKTGKKYQILSWTTPNGNKYLYKRCRYGIVEEDRTRCRLFTLANPVARTGKQLSYIQMWDPVTGELKKSSLIEESLSALAVRDDGRFAAVGTMFSGSVFLYIAFSLQRVMTVNNAHSMFVTGLEFLPALCDNQPSITTLSEAAVISISVDNKICIHSLPFRRSLPPWLVIMFIIVTLFFTFVFCSYMGL
ncbi:prolactin regulatory element-binding protein [Nilaparvata lugens]|uniref:prolactin regulatory element-binding protein n=1 Tax=Nilaparvata lugens TaxID=108931 RepID=UPI00193D7927|nr:prolactin regulatory element-binding protein [Nilaparvata lugens]